ncbi:MAG: shikimate kinase [Euzebya sp.]
MSVITPGRNIVLIGLMGAGKSTVGRLVAHILERPFVDTDEVVQHVEGRSIAQIFTEDGEREFRVFEAAAVRQVSAIRGQVVAVGGGAVTDPANVTQLRGTGDLIWLDAPVSAMVMNLTDAADRGVRPLLGSAATLSEDLQRLYTDRFDAYRRAATHILYTQGRPIEVIADEVVRWARLQPGLLTREERL